MELYYTPKARNDLLQIKESIIEKFDDEDLAKKILRKMTETVRQLITFPYLGQELSGITGIYTDYRCLFCEKNYVFYRIEADRVCVIRVLNERQDYMRILFGVLEKN
ncbi:MAG TPA: type II toxin-antitoxin system RelE/ParE family toxin [Candidatus Mediterraneibacter avicola]|nr:type II toxin-antitoxin system RelE/ParE family toxin [Candidatus Mediterraneibacter avicola]